MNKSKYNYPISIRPLESEDGGGYLAEVPDLPGCIADGKTVNEALTEIASAIKSWIETAKEFGDPIPKPSIAKNFSGQWRMRVPKHLHADLALRAKEEGVSLNTLATTLLAEGISKRSSVRTKKEKTLTRIRKTSHATTPHHLRAAKAKAKSKVRKK